MAATLAIKVDDDTRCRLKALGEARQRSPDWLLKDAICRYLDREEAIERRNQEADQAWQEFQVTGAFVSNEDMEAWLDTWGTDHEAQSPSISK